MLGWLRSLVPRTTLAGIREPARVSVRGQVITPNEVTSPLSGTRAALFSWCFYVRWSNENRELLADRDLFGRNGDRYDLLFSCVYGGDLLLSTADGNVLVPREGLSIRFSHVDPWGTPIEGPLPEEIAARVLSMPEAQRGVVVHQELSLGFGDAVRLRAIVEAVPHGGGTYREAGGAVAPFRVRPDLQPAVIDDESLQG